MQAELDKQGIEVLLDNADKCVHCGLCAREYCNARPTSADIGTVASMALEHRLEGGGVDFDATVNEALDWARRCSLCDRCTNRCPVDISCAQTMIAIRSEARLDPKATDLYLSHHSDRDATVFTLLQELMGTTYDDALLPAMPIQGDDPADRTLFMPGCTLDTYAPQLTNQVFDWLKEHDVARIMTDKCCGRPATIAGEREDAATYRTAFADRLEAMGVTRIVAACPNCGGEMANLLAATGLSDKIEVVPLPRVLADAGMRVDAAMLEASGVGATATCCVHDSCPDRTTGAFGEAVREILGDVATVERAHTGRDTLCCGSGGLCTSWNMDLADERGREARGEIAAAGASCVVAACVSCVNGYARIEGDGMGDAAGTSDGIAARHYLELLFGTRIDWEGLREAQERMWSPQGIEWMNWKYTHHQPILPPYEPPLVGPGVVPPKAGKWRVRTNCHFCGYLCGLFATVQDGRVVDLAPDTSRYPYVESVISGCPRWRRNIKNLESDERINHPLRRVGERGSGQWEQVSWDEALDGIAKRLLDLRERYGAETLASAIGGPHATFWPLHRFLSLYGTPNNMGIGQICWNPRIWMDTVTFGWPIEAAFNDKSSALFLWGTNPAESDNSLFWHGIRDFARGGKPLVVVDSRYSRTAKQATIWLSPRPGTDCTLALGLIQQVIEQGGVDRAFVDEWCHGYDELAAHVAAFTPERIERECGVPADKLAAAAALWCTGEPVALISGRGVDQLGPNTAPTHRAIACLRAITGNIDRDGACHLLTKSTFLHEVDLEMTDRLTPEQRAKSLNNGVCTLQSYAGWEAISELTAKVDGNRLPGRYLTSVHPGRVWRAATTGEPYRVSALISMGCDPIVTYGDAHLVHDAIMGLELYVALEQHMTPSAMLADYVLPIASALERPLLQVDGGIADVAYGGERAVDPYYERRPDYEVFRELGLRCGQSVDDWPDETLSQAHARTMAPTGLTWEQFCDVGIWAPAQVFGTYRDNGFATTTGKIELASEFLPRFGGDRVPVPAPVEQPQGFADGVATQAVEAGEKGAPLMLMTGARFLPFYASSSFEDPAVRKTHPHPWAELAPATAERLGLEAGDKVIVSTDHGEALFEVRLTEMVEDTVSVEYGWWFPEDGVETLGGAWRSNANTLTGCDIPDGKGDLAADNLIGTWRYGALPCHVRKA